MPSPAPSSSSQGSQPESAALIVGLTASDVVQLSLFPLADAETLDGACFRMYFLTKSKRRATSKSSVRTISFTFSASLWSSRESLRSSTFSAGDALFVDMSTVSLSTISCAIKNRIGILLDSPPTLSVGLTACVRRAALKP
jgi:hypothetical protein